jgi:hypothetical protein
MIKTPQDRTDRTYSVPNHGSNTSAITNIKGNKDQFSALPFSPGANGPPGMGVVHNSQNG